jgi:hypothetical protein
MNSNDKGSGPSLGIGIVLVALGALFLLEQVFGFQLGPWLWPFFIVIPGLLFFVGMLFGGKSASPLAIPGSIVTMVGLILLYQNTFNHFESWAYAWALIPVAVGIGMLIQGTWSDRPVVVQQGRRVMSVGLVLLAIGFVFFELVLNIGGGIAGGIVGPLLLIAGGLALLWRNVARRASLSSPVATPVEALPVAAAAADVAVTQVAQQTTPTPRAADEGARPTEPSPVAQVADAEPLEHEIAA